MKRNCIITLALIVASALIMTASFEACKKDVVNPTPINNSVVGNENNGKPVKHDVKFIVNQIKTFKKQLEVAQMYSWQKNAEYLPVDSAIWNMEALLNTTYGFPDEIYEDKVMQSLTFNIAVNSDNKVSMNDVSTLYSQIKESVKQAYSNDGFTSDKALMTVVMSPGEKFGGSQDIDVKVISGRTNHNNYYELQQFYIGPFGTDDCWYFGNYGGTCDDPTIPLDAAEMIEDSINYYEVCHEEQMSQYRNIYVSQYVVELIGNEYFNNNQNDYYLFYKPRYPDEDLNLDGSTMNKYYQNEIKVIKEIIPNDPNFIGKIPENPIFMGVDIRGLMDNSRNMARHANYITYGSKYEVHKSELGEPIDILSQNN